MVSTLPRKRLRQDRFHDPPVEQETLSKADSGARRQKSADPRTPFQRDRDRILYSSAFRRLAGVTQVVSAQEGHFFHNRLTHSLKVAQIARRLAEALIAEDQKLPKPGAIELMGGLDPDVAETAALAHDLGHPPFGHAAETELDDRTRKHGIIDGFEGNAQTFRIVTRVATHKTSAPNELRGMDLTRASLDAILKYPWSRESGGKEFRKWGYYHSEKKEFQFARGLHPASDRGRSVEAEVMDWADDVTYAVHDVDDFYRAGFLPLDRLLRADADGTAWREWKEFLKGEPYQSYLAGLKASASEDDQLTLKNADGWADNLWRSMNGLSDALEVPFQGTRLQKAGLHRLFSFLFDRFVNVRDHPGEGRKLALRPGGPAKLWIHPQLRFEVKLLKCLPEFYVFRHPTVLAQQMGQRKVVGDLFEKLFEATQTDSHYQAIIPPFYLEDVIALNGKLQAEEMSLDDAERERARLVADMISAMSEDQALSLYSRLNGFDSGSVWNQILR